MLRITNDALTFDDVLLLPALSHVLPSEVDLKTRLTRTITSEHSVDVRRDGHRNGMRASPLQWRRKAASASCTRT